MRIPAVFAQAGRVEAVAAVLVFVVAVAFHSWGASVGWESKNLPGVEYRQAQTALSAYFIDLEDNFSLAYPTPVLGKPWSIPMEFPLYQWTVVGASRLTGMELTRAGRLVSVACFYLTLPGIFLLLRRWQVKTAHRWLALALVASCPFYVFYARAFLIETMALMFAVWFWVAFERAVIGRSVGWLGVAVVAGSGAALVKVTTLLLYLLPLALWSSRRLWLARAGQRWWSEVAWMGGAAVLPLLAAIWWVGEADRIKALNPVADFLGSQHMRDFNFGTSELRFSPEIWAMKWRIVRDELTFFPLVWLIVPVLWLGQWRRAGAVGLCLVVFTAALVVFPLLYAYHDYYYVANAVLAMLALALALIGLAESPRWRWLAVLLVVGCVAGQMVRYRQHYWPIQQGISAGGNALTSALRKLTAVNDVIVIVGEDWNSMTPYFAQRRALMLRADVEDDPARVDIALTQLAAERIGAWLVTGKSWRERSILGDRLAARGLSPRPLLQWNETVVFVRQEQESEIIRTMLQDELPGLAWAPGAAPVAKPLAGRWSAVAGLPPAQRMLFASMQPQPVRFFSSFEPARQVMAGEYSFNAHPVTRFVFAVSAGRRHLRTQVWFTPDAYAQTSADRTDGVELILLAQSADGGQRELSRQFIDPVNEPGDRGARSVHFIFEIAEDAEIELVVGPGPQGRDTRDWIWLRGPLTID
ncbi:MAG: hypothetical protein C0518_00430 [Opitutus sp.]|nr:hypothetical protein [Opitutus sp.]